MAHIVAVHSWRGGTGKSTVVCRLGAQLAARGRRVGLVDASLQAPGLHDAAGIDESRLRLGLADYLVGRCEIEDVPCDVSHLVPGGGGQMYLVPAATDTENITLPAFGRYDPGLLTDGFHQLTSALDLDFLLVDTHAGINYEAVYTIGAADVVILVVRSVPAERRGVRLAAAFAAQICRCVRLLVVNAASLEPDGAALRRHIEAECGIPIAAVVPCVPGLDDAGADPADVARDLAPSYREMADSLTAVAGLPARA
jgi:MinD-like ATPase involved in chromosome partitioning or flagellar assembly